MGPAAAPTIRNHRRFALTEVTLEDQPVGGATVDIWQDATGTSCWSARVLMRAQDMPQDGMLAGKTRDGGVLRGSVALIGPGPGVGGSRGPVLMEWRGVGALRADDPSPGG